jgi:multiple sugar transport system ATP-binding protein
MQFGILTIKSYHPPLLNKEGRTMSSVELKDIYKRYGKVEAVRGISMDIANGEFVAFLGPSGCGKSSTMRMIAGLEEITSGDILFEGSSVIDKKPKDRNVSMAFENYALYPTLTVYENLAFPLRAAGWSNNDVNQRVREVAEVVGIVDLFERKPGRLSSGQSQSVGLARALIRKPNVFLLDEPISHLDTSQRFHMRGYIKRLHIELGYTMIYVTHDQEDAMALADRIAVMATGNLSQIDTPREIYDHPADLFVAGFIGSPPMNFLNCQYVKENDHGIIRHQDLSMEVPPHYRGLEGEGMMPADLVLGIRPFYINLAFERGDLAPIPAEIFVVEPLGDITVVNVCLCGETRFQVVVPPFFCAHRKQEVWIGLDPAHILLFDKTTEKALPRTL